MHFLDEIAHSFFLQKKALRRKNVKYLCDIIACVFTGTFEQRKKHLDDLLGNAERRRDDLASTLATKDGHPKDAERQKAIWDRKYKMLRKMKAGLDKIRKENMPL